MAVTSTEPLPTPEERASKELTWDWVRMMRTMFFTFFAVAGFQMAQPGSGWWGVYGIVGGCFFVACLLELHHDN